MRGGKSATHKRRLNTPLSLCYRTLVESSHTARRRQIQLVAKRVFGIPWEKRGGPAGGLVALGDSAVWSGSALDQDRWATKKCRPRGRNLSQGFPPGSRVAPKQPHFAPVAGGKGSSVGLPRAGWWGPRVLVANRSNGGGRSGGDARYHPAALLCCRVRHSSLHGRNRPCAVLVL